ncbi:MAG: 50S ribosomal protein L4 [Acidobacteriota bacterium]
MNISVKNMRGDEVGEVEVPDTVFGYAYNEHLIHTVVRAILAARRAGTHKTKVRSEVAGSGKKLWRQKGTGRARMGSIRSPLWRKGGTIHGPQPRDYTMGVSVQEKKVALRSALSRKLENGEFIVVDSLERDSHKTASLVADLATLGIERKVLLVDDSDNHNLELAARNNQKVKTVRARGVNVYDVVDRDVVVISQAALTELVAMLEPKKRRQSASDEVSA